ncbi:MAG TPA: HAMP domain-containing sensor histidine kinase, partial [Gammaproteobacteria bacterium]
GLRRWFASPEAQIWRPLRLFSLYRLTLTTLLILLYLSHNLPLPLSGSNEVLFYRFALVYLLLATLAMAGCLQRTPPFQVQLYAHAVIDIVFLTLLMHVSGGITGGVGMLLVISVAIASMIAPGRSAGLFASVATIAVLAEQLYGSLFGGTTSYTQAGLLGAALFTTAIVANVLGRQARESEALAKQRGIDLANMEQLADHVIHQMQTGVLVVDGEQRVRLMNGAARELLNVAPDLQGAITLGIISADLQNSLQAWRHGAIENASIPQLRDLPQQVLPRFKAIEQRQQGGVMIFLEEISRTAHQAQQLKLASLGRLTAGIAHEVRNPLGAISHAGELLGESPQLDSHDRRLVQIIIEQSRRMNTIIENVMQLGRRDRARPEVLPFGPWLRRFVDDFLHATQTPAAALRLSLAPEGMAVEFDPGHLQQILWNLCQNGLRHSGAGDDPRLELLAGLTLTGRPYLDVIDHGPGVPAEHLDNIFEPFFTTDHRGTGLGLYISRELAECNFAQLRYQPRDGRSCFRLSFKQSLQAASTS